MLWGCLKSRMFYFEIWEYERIVKIIGYCGEIWSNARRERERERETQRAGDTDREVRQRVEERQQIRQQILGKLDRWPGAARFGITARRSHP